MTKKTKGEFVNCFIIILALVIRIFNCLIKTVHYRDTYKYVEFAKRWKDTQIFDLEQSFMPLPIYILKVVSEKTDMSIAHVGIIINMLSSIGIVYIAIIIADMLFHNIKAKIACGLLIATQPALVEYSNEIIRENFFILFLELSLLFFLLFYQKRNLVYIGLSGGITAFAILCRIEGLEIVLIIAILILLTMKRKRIVLIITYASCLILTFLAMNEKMSIPQKYYIHVIESKD